MNHIDMLIKSNSALQILAMEAEQAANEFKEQIESLQKQNELMRSTIEYYANKESWQNSISKGVIRGVDVDVVGETYRFGCNTNEPMYAGGKRARECLKKIKELSNGK